MKQQLLTISQLAKYVGVTVRAVRHYHSLGLLPEPLRDSSGYRRYGAEEVIALTRIKILAEAGVPLSQIQQLTQASEKIFTKAITSIKLKINLRIKELKKILLKLDKLQSGERMFVSKTVADYLNYLKKIGLSNTIISYERNTWILISALYPGYSDSWASQKKMLLTNPNMASLYRRLDEARNWLPTDYRLNKLAKDMVTLTNTNATTSVQGQDKLIGDKQALFLISQYSTYTFPAFKKLRDIIEKLEVIKK